MNMTISKSKFIAGCQCLKRLYLQVHEPELAAEPNAVAEAIIEQGRKVGLLAREMFPDGVEVRSDDLGQAIRSTRELIANPTKDLGTLPPKFATSLLDISLRARARGFCSCVARPLRRNACFAAHGRVTPTIVTADPVQVAPS
jgi:hypothetical protein